MCVWSTALFIVGFVFNRYKISNSNPGFSLIAQTVKNLPVVQETQVRSLDWGDPLEKEMATPSSILAWRIPWIDEPGGLQSTASQKSDMICDETTTTLVFTHYKIVKPTSWITAIRMSPDFTKSLLKDKRDFHFWYLHIVVRPLPASSSKFFSSQEKGNLYTLSDHCPPSTYPKTPASDNHSSLLCLCGFSYFGCFLFHVPPQDYCFWELVSWPWLTKCSLAWTFWFSVLPSSLASLRETHITGSSWKRTTD